MHSSPVVQRRSRMTWKPTVVLCVALCASGRVALSSQLCTGSAARQPRLQLRGDLPKTEASTVPGYLVSRLKGGYRSESGGNGGKERHRRRSRDGKGKAGQGGDRGKTKPKEKDRNSELAFQGGPPTLDKLLDDPAVQEFASSLFSNPGFQAVANNILSDQQNLDLLRTYAGANTTATPEDAEELRNFMGALSMEHNATAEESNATSAAANANSSAANVSKANDDIETGEKQDMADLMEAMGQVAKGAMASQWSYAKENQMRQDPELAAVQDSPKMKEMQAEVAAHGPMAVLKYVNDPEALGIIQKIIGVTMQ